MPNVTRNQASISYFVELGNGDKDTHGTTGLRQSYVGVKPRMAVGYHSTITPTTVIDINDGVRETYDGPLEIAQDLMVINVTKDQIVVREVSVYDNAYPPGTSQAYKDAKRSGEAKVSEDIEAGKWKGYTPPPMPEK
jgi:ribonuclease Z